MLTGLITIIIIARLMPGLLPYWLALVAFRLIWWTIQLSRKD